MPEAPALRHLCVECRWCELKADPERGSYYRCARGGERLPAAILRRGACENFVPQSPAAHWGP